MLHLAACAVLLPIALGDSTTVSVSWGSVTGVSDTTTTLQVVTSPMMSAPGRPGTPAVPDWVRQNLFVGLLDGGRQLRHDSIAGG
eukprot:gene2336-biopygen2824